MYYEGILDPISTRWLAPFIDGPDSHRAIPLYNAACPRALCARAVLLAGGYQRITRDLCRAGQADGGSSVNIGPEELRKMQRETEFVVSGTVFFITLFLSPRLPRRYLWSETAASVDRVSLLLFGAEYGPAGAVRGPRFDELSPSAVAHGYCSGANPQRQVKLEPHAHIKETPDAVCADSALGFGQTWDTTIVPSLTVPLSGNCLFILYYKYSDTF
ncbi:hypothetical protein EDB83DRAFT_2319490 [Lactarius deliciosus]|nr:hypothetical protein EDB83DRAFT_2319490 [Lactarius deliciosus]